MGPKKANKSVKAKKKIRTAYFYFSAFVLALVNFTSCLLFHIVFVSSFTCVFWLKLWGFFLMGNIASKLKLYKSQAVQNLRFKCILMYVNCWVYRTVFYIRRQPEIENANGGHCIAAAHTAHSVCTCANSPPAGATCPCLAACWPSEQHAMYTVLCSLYQKTDMLLDQAIVQYYIRTLELDTVYQGFTVCT